MPRLLLPKRHKSSPGANLMLLCAVAVVIVGFLGISIYTGLQTFLEGDLQRASMNAALVGAAAYYNSPSGSATAPVPDAGGASALATTTFNTLVSSSTLNGFNTQLISATSNDSNDSITVTAKSTVGTGFLAPIGIKSIEVNAVSTARALKYEPTAFTGPIKITPDGVTPASYSETLTLAFPLVDGPGNDMYLEQNFIDQQGYIVEACNSIECYDVTKGATPVGTSHLDTVNGQQVIYGTAMVDIGRVGVRKATKLRITHCNLFNAFNKGVLKPKAIALPDPLIIQRVMIFGYAGTCVSATSCGIPAGFTPVFI
jgi:hypothetical protein